MDGRSSSHRVTSAPLADFVDFLWLSEGYAPTHAAERLLPTGCMSLVVEMRPDGRVPGFISGMRAASFILDEPAVQPYGDRRCALDDPEGHRWYFAQSLSG